MAAPQRPPLRPTVLLLLLLASLPVLANTQSGWRERLPQASLIGSGDFSWFGFSVYNAKLWSPERRVDFSQPFALELTYRRSISRETLVDTSLDEIRRINGEPLDREQQQDWAQQMRQAFVDVQDGTRITGVFLPDEGCRFYVDGKLQHVIDDPEFARAFFSIWLDPQTRSPKLRAALLGLAQ
ncbi:chalcone isomerase family protein [Pseudomonas berkeleyensis]|uniref:Chalcone isomerase family protein n=1 Tax=Pseudomonas berkeleyensis TaxID=2726956 RepID=A0A7G5DJ96_9PSED|nr:chalcone isomerase family protein [Pseudomonas berkeleyensis]QMV61821.1 chalcone isomerase family protein [Pseudomonas berkeleyensis]WSO37253.1 chalcone isomerase family protein [Pseudomonas berkeleyensis]